jgi:general secretion pathway protein L
MASSTITNFPVQVWQWWLQELQSLVPMADQRKLANRRTRREIVINAGQISLHEKQKLTEALHPSTLVVGGEKFSDLLAKTKRIGEVVLSFGKSEYFVRSSVLPVQALPRAKQILDLELRQVLPLASSEIFTGWYQAGQQHNGHASLVQVAIKRSRVEELVASLRQAGVKTSAIAFRDGSNSALPIVMDIDGKIFGASSNVIWRRITAGLFAAALVLLAAFTWFAFNRQNTEIETVAAASDEMRAKAVQVRKSIEASEKQDARIANLIKMRKQAPNLVAIWDNLAFILPDKAWISTFTLNDKTFSLDGEAADAEGLLKLLETSQFFKNVRFTAPVTRNPGAELSHYTIAMEYEDLQ